MHTIDMIISRKKYNTLMPSSWADIEPQDWYAIAPYIAQDDIWNPEVARRLIRVKRRLWGKKRMNRNTWNQIPVGGKYAILNELNWLDSELCTKPPFPFIRVNRQRMYLPDSHLKNLTIIEFAFLDMCFQVIQMMEKQDQPYKADDWAKKLCAYMCRPRDRRIDPTDPMFFLGDQREKFNTKIIEARIPGFMKMRQSDKLGCLFFFTHCKRYLHKKYKGTLWHDTHTDDGKEIIGVPQNQKPEPLRWMKVINRLAGGKFGDLQQTRYSNLYDVLDELADQARNRKNTQ